jgi:hypothetical protein
MVRSLGVQYDNVIVAGLSRELPEFHGAFNFAFIDVHLEETFFHCAVREDHFALPMLDATAPVSLVRAAIGPDHLSEAVSFIFFVLSFVEVSTGPVEDTEAMLFIISVVAFVLVALGSFAALPLSLPVLEARLELSYVK